MRRILTSITVAVLLVVMFGVTPQRGVRAASGQGAARENQPVYTTPNGFLLGPPVPGAYADLVRNKTGLTASVHTSVTDRGAYTLWWVIFNHPESCVTYLCTYDAPDLLVSASGHIVSALDGANLSAHLTAGGPYSGEVLYVGADPGLTNPRGALITLVLRYHGPAQPGEIPQQFSTYLGGCPEDGGLPCQDIQLAVFPGDCAGACSTPF
jgi:hypothetical protein